MCVCLVQVLQEIGANPWYQVQTKHMQYPCLLFTLTVPVYCFGRAVTVCPDEGFSKYMYLGQLMEGQQAIECFQKGVELMTEELQKSQVSLTFFKHRKFFDIEVYLRSFVFMRVYPNMCMHILVTLESFQKCAMIIKRNYIPSFFHHIE